MGLPRGGLGGLGGCFGALWGATLGAQFGPPCRRDLHPFCLARGFARKGLRAELTSRAGHLTDTAEGPVWGQKGHQKEQITTVWWLSLGPRWRTRVSQRGAKLGPKGPLEPPWGVLGPRRHHEVPRTPWEPPPGRLQEKPLLRPGGSQEAPGGPQEAQRMPQDAPG